MQAAKAHGQVHLDFSLSNAQLNPAIFRSHFQSHIVSVYKLLGDFSRGFIIRTLYDLGLNDMAVDAKKITPYSPAQSGSLRSSGSATHSVTGNSLGWRHDDEILRSFLE
jgi:hypothetical protein